MKDTERGMASVELAFAVVGLSMAVGVAVWFVVALGVLGQCQTTANEVARQHARGDSAAVARVVAAGPSGASVSYTRSKGFVEVLVSKQMRLGPWVSLPLQARASVAEE